MDAHSERCACKVVASYKNLSRHSNAADCRLYQPIDLSILVLPHALATSPRGSRYNFLTS